jgi:hypothetical protein
MKAILTPSFTSEELAWMAACVKSELLTVAGFVKQFAKETVYADELAMLRGLEKKFDAREKQLRGRCGL